MEAKFSAPAGNKATVGRPLPDASPIPRAGPVPQPATLPHHRRHRRLPCLPVPSLPLPATFPLPAPSPFLPSSNAAPARFACPPLPALALLDFPTSAFPCWQLVPTGHSHAPCPSAASSRSCPGTALLSLEPVGLQGAAPAWPAVPVSPHPLLSPPTPPDSETGEDEPSDPQVTQRSELQDETAFSTPTGEQGARGWHRAPAPAAGHGPPRKGSAGPALGVSIGGEL